MLANYKTMLSPVPIVMVFTAYVARHFIPTSPLASVLLAFVAYAIFRNWACETGENYFFTDTAWANLVSPLHGRHKEGDLSATKELIDMTKLIVRNNYFNENNPMQCLNALIGEPTASLALTKLFFEEQLNKTDYQALQKLFEQIRELEKNPEKKARLTQAIDSFQFQFFSQNVWLVSQSEEAADFPAELHQLILSTGAAVINKPV